MDDAKEVTLYQLRHWSCACSPAPKSQLSIARGPRQNLVLLALVFCLPFRQNVCFKMGKKCISRPKEHDQFWSCFFPSFFASFASNGQDLLFFLAFQKAKNVGRSFTCIHPKHVLHICAARSVPSRYLYLLAPGVVCEYSHYTIVADMIAESIRFEPKICICNAN